MSDRRSSPTIAIEHATSPATDDELWSIKKVREKTGLARATIYKYVGLGLFPRQCQLGPGRVAWRASEVRAWIQNRPS